MHGVIELLGGAVGLAHFQKNRASESQQCDVQERPCNSMPAEIGCHGEVQNLLFTRRDCAANQEPCDGISDNRDQKFLIQVVRYGPLRGLRTGLLDGGDGREIYGDSQANRGEGPGRAISWHI